VLQLHFAAAFEVRQVATSGQPERIPEANGRLNSSLVLECTKGRSCVKSPVTPRAAGQTVLEEHTDDGQHGQTAVGNFGVQLALQNLRVIGCDWLPAIVARGAVVLVHIQLVVASESHDLGPPTAWNLGDRCESVGHIGKFQAHRWGQIARPPEVLRDDVTHCCVHGHSAVLDLCLPPSLEGLVVAISAVACRVPESYWRLDAELCLEGLRGHQLTGRSSYPPLGGGGGGVQRGAGGEGRGGRCADACQAAGCWSGWIGLLDGYALHRPEDLLVAGRGRQKGTSGAKGNADACCSQHGLAAAHLVP